MTATTTTAADSLDLVSGKTLVLLGAALKEERPHGRVGFHYGEGVDTVHTAGMRGICSYARDPTATLLVSGQPSCAGITDCEVHATPEQADYARRVLAVLLPASDVPHDITIDGARWPNA